MEEGIETKSRLEREREREGEVMAKDATVAKTSCWPVRCMNVVCFLASAGERQRWKKRGRERKRSGIMTDDVGECLLKFSFFLSPSPSRDTVVC